MEGGSNGRLQIEVDWSCDTLSILKSKIEQEEGTPASKQLLTFADGLALYDNEALLSSQEQLEEGATLQLSIIPEDHFLVIVEQASEKSTHFTVGRHDTVLGLKRKLEREKGVTVARQIVLRGGVQVADSAMLSNLVSEGGENNLLVVVELQLRYQVTIQMHTGDSFDLAVAWDEPVETLDLAVNRRGRVPYHHQELMFGDQVLELGHRISEYGVEDGSHITVHLRDYETMVFIKTLTGRTIMVMVGPHDTVAQVKRKIEQQEGIPASHQRLIFVGEQLHDQHCLLDYRIEHESAVHLVLRSGDSYEVYVDVPGGRSHAFEVLPSDGLAYVKNKLREREGISLDLMELYLGDQLLDENVSLRENGVSAGNTLRLVVDQGKDTQIFIGLPNRDSLSIWVSTDMTVAQLKQVIESRVDIPADLQQLYFARQQLDNERTLQSYTIESNHMLHVEIVQPPTLKLTVHFPDGSEQDVELTTNQTIAALKREIEAKNSVLSSTQQLFFQGIELDDNSTLVQCGLANGNIVDCSSSRSVAATNSDSSGGEMHLFVKTLTGKTVTVVIKPTDTILDVKQRIMEKEGVALAHQCLICAGKQLENSRSIQDCGIQHQSVLHLVLRVPSLGPISLAVERNGQQFTVEGVSISETVAQLKVGIILFYEGVVNFFCIVYVQKSLVVRSSYQMLSHKIQVLFNKNIFHDYINIIAGEAGAHSEYSSRAAAIEFGRGNIS